MGRGICMKGKIIDFPCKLWLKKDGLCDTISSYRYGHTMSKFKYLEVRIYAPYNRCSR